MGVRITNIAYAVPSRRLTHDDLARRFGKEQMDKTVLSTGIRERRVVPDGVCASDLAAHAADALFSTQGVDAQTIDLLLFATQTPDYLLPSTSCILQERLHLRKTTAAFDINLGCSQYVYSLAVATAMIEANMVEKALVMTGDTVSRIIHPLDRSVIPLFGDAGTATIVSRGAKNEGFISFDFGTDGAGAGSLIWPTSGLRLQRSEQTAEERTDKSGSTRRQDDMFMDGTAIFMFTMRVIPETIGRVLSKANASLDDVDLFIFHQASKFIVDNAIRKLKIPAEKVHMKMEDFGNSGGSTVAICLADAIAKGRLKPGMKVVMSAFGVGLSWASTFCVWSADTSATALDFEC